MLTGEGLIGKTITAIVVKAASKLLALPFDKRRSIAQALTKLYFATVQLDEVTDQFLEIFDRFSKGVDTSEALHIAIKSKAQAIDAASYTFAELSDELHDALLILDPILANCLNFLETGKGNFLSFLSCSIQVSTASDKPKITVEVPNAIILSTDFQSIYDVCTQKHKRGERYYWPEGVFDYFNDFNSVDITFIEPQAATELASMIRHQNALLKQARESLRALLRDSLTIEEVFFASKERGHQ
ncbi:hypothetical protein CAP31_06845 [Sulfuriferula sp. AH1]|uniref:hypothetical protein n=1 Tax=Sulfuriferula sp. AH1 TaxID=1985873 RepID=UPI000B3B84EF|nr:hypothetical protein [Sulfuriferula sp. AH1]ARU31423.1 hypothetical protein CAP31_06845 [Sulfuriferula sp. AH1]